MTEDTPATTNEAPKKPRHGQLNVKINQPTYAAIKSLEASMDVTATEVIRRAVALIHLVETKRADGQELAFLGEDGKRVARVEFMY